MSLIACLDHVPVLAERHTRGALARFPTARRPPTYARIHEARIAAAAAQVEHELGADAYQAAFQRGAAMTYDEIIAYTLDQLAQLAKQ